ncbi:hypothetical protein [Roseateles puraquae]|jgi:hypothetical protein|uniref:Porin domain-containing protein n=1 Tax=Roseateles puraquae TaxID=431059 RepID=A0A254NN56_9BURK|nr:hypothetical protein [Roseateles puraquae]MDG0855705.1 hypothetical protein [Roseateles puraquae]OWR05903.1 hypothetical protein CDO81_05540 [Roseateles puraquae]
MMVHARHRLLPLLLALAAGGASAADGMFSLSGFGTLGLVRTSTDDAQFALFGQTRGADKDVSAEVDSKLGVQVGAKFNDMFSGTLQVLTKSNGKGNFTPGVEWAFLKAQVTPALSLRAGRMGAPFFAVSDFRDVGYANTALRPPKDVYDQVPVSHFDGADASYQLSTSVGTLTGQLFGGKASDTSQRYKVDVKSLAGFNATLETDAGLTLRLGYAEGKLTVGNAALNGLVATLRATPFASVGNQLDPNDSKGTFSGVGLTWDQGDWVASAEYTQRRIKTFLADTDGWYVLVGHRFGPLTPYVTVSEARTVSSNVNNTIPAATAQLAALKAAVDSVVEGQRHTQKTFAVGARWDFARNLALKAQWENVRPDGRGYFISPTANWGNGKTVNVISVALDTVF